ncbi:MAG: sigma-70 family RNA polymerase sigma factor [Bacteroidota bacterium]
MALLKEKKRSALEYLYDHYNEALYGVVFRIVQQEKIAEEVLQDTFLKIWNNIATYDSGKGRLFTWMLNIARNLAIDKVRSKEFSYKSKTDSLENTVSTTSPDMYVEQRIKDHGLVNLLQHLSSEQQMIVDLIYFKGYTHLEIAKEFDIPLGTVKTRLRSALGKLRKILNIT